MEVAAVASSNIVVGSISRCTQRAARPGSVMGMQCCRRKMLGLRLLPTSGHALRTVQRRRLFVPASLEDAASVGVQKEMDESAEVSDTPPDSSDSPVEGDQPEASTEEAAQALDEQTERSKAVLDEVVNNLKDVLKVQDATKQVYAESAEKAIGVLKDTTEQLKEQAEKAKAVLLATAQGTAEKGKENLSMLVENAADPLLRDIAETALSAHFPEQTKQAAGIHDFCLGIPYGSILLTGGLLWFLLTGSTAALRFGVFLGGSILFLSVTSLKVWKRGESSVKYIKAQGVIASILLVRELRRYLEVKKFFPHAAMALLSLGMLGFYIYVFVSGGNPPKKTKEAQAA